MLDFHFHPENWGIWPVAGYLGPIPITTYFIFSFLGLIVAGIVFYYFSEKQKLNRTESLFIIMAGLFGGAIGAKIPILLMYAENIANGQVGLELIISGKTITGGLIGGAICVWLVKKALKIKFRIGNSLAPAVAIGIAFGRIGCFFTGCCYGKATQSDWFGVNFGDGILRHPTQIYEALFSLIQFFVFIVILKKRGSDLKQGVLFDFYLLSYFVFRFFLEFIKEENQIYLSLTIFQWISILVFVRYLFKYIMIQRDKGRSKVLLDLK
jgi:phosphatidylglycerol:prolipoprotein diacylglycerol transferase